MTAGEKDARRFGISSDEEGYRTRNRGADAGGEQTDIVTVAFSEGATDETEIVPDHFLNSEAGRVIGGQVLAQPLAVFA